jgi:hypothetical protein
VVTARTTLVVVVAVATVCVAALIVFGVFSGNPSPAVASPAPTFIDETTASGLVHSYDGDWTFYVGGGVATFDCNDDGLLDVFVAGGQNSSSLFRNVSTVGGDIRFVDATTSTTSIDLVTGAYPIDLDSDQLVDIVVLRNGPNVVLRGMGGCEFEYANDALNVDGGHAWTTAFSATWEGSNSLPTLAFGNYVLLDADGFQNGDCYDNSLVRPIGGFYGSEVPLHPGWCTLSMLFSDWNRTGNQDLRVSNDRHYYRDGEEQLWRIRHGEPPELYGPEDGWNSVQVWGMGIASHDIAGDARPEVFLTSQGDNKLQILREGATGPDYLDIAIRRGITAHRPFAGGDVRPSTAWHPEFRDVNNDGFIDLFISKGNVDNDPGFAAEDPNNLFIGQPDGTFIEGAIDAGILHYSRSRGASLADFNNDGWLDLIEVNRTENVRVWRNTGSETLDRDAGHWIGVSLEQDAPNRDAVGAWVSVKVGGHVMERELTVGGGHVSGQHGPMHFGLGPASAAQVMVEWPDGSRTDWLPVEANRFVIVSNIGSGQLVER